MDRLTRTVREQIALGRLLPLGGCDDALWITESAAVRVLRRACARLPGVRLGAVDVALAGPVSGTVPKAAPTGALPHVPVRIDAAFEAAVDEPLPLRADRLRRTLWATAEDLVGLTVAAVDLRVTGLLEGDAPGPDAAPGVPGPELAGEDYGSAQTMAGGTGEAIEAAVRAAPGVLGLTRRLAGFGSGLWVHDTTGPGQAPGRWVQVQIAVAQGRVPLQVARVVLSEVSAAAAPGAPGPVSAAVVVTDAG